MNAPRDLYNIDYFDHSEAWINTQNIVGSLPIQHIHLRENGGNNSINPLRVGGLFPPVENSKDVKYLEAYIKDEWDQIVLLPIGDEYSPFVAGKLQPDDYTFYLNLLDEGAWGLAMGVYNIHTELYLVDIYGDPINLIGVWDVSMDNWYPNERGQTSPIFPYFYDPDNCVQNEKKPYVLTNSLNEGRYSSNVELYLPGIYMMEVYMVAEARVEDYKTAYISFLVQ